jgi:di/tricarboxylate transporter
VGAGSHLIANDLLHEVTGRAVGFGEWMLYGLPFGVAASAITCAVVLRLFLAPDCRASVLRVPPFVRTPLSPAEKKTLAVAAAMVGLWLTHRSHGIEIATTSFVGAFVLTLPAAGVIGWKAGLKAVSWNLVFFVGAALVLGEALIDTGAAQWLVTRMFHVAGLAGGGPQLLLLAGLALLTLTSHIYLTSHAARAAALVPPLLYLAQALQANPVAVMFIATVGMNYCLTFPVSSKALLLFQELDEATWSPADLLKLSAVLLPAHALLMVAFYYGWWRHVGLAL